MALQELHSPAIWHCECETDLESFQTPHKPFVMVKMDSSKLFLPGTIFFFYRQGPSLWTYFSVKYGLACSEKFGPPSGAEIMQTPGTYFTCKIWPVAYLGGFLRFLEATQSCQFSSTQCTVASFPAACNIHFTAQIFAFCTVQMLCGPTWGIPMET